MKTRTVPANLPAVCAGRVILREGDQLCVATEEGAGEVIARTAASCLLRPEPGDRVLVSLAPEPWVLAVLERAGSRRAEIVFEGDTVLRTTSGSMALDASDGLRLAAGRSISMLSPSLGFESEQTTVVVERLEAVGRAAKASFDEVGLVSKLYDRVAERVTERAARVFRFVSELDQLRAQRFDHRAERTAEIKAEHVAISARQVAKMDGEQVHIG